QRRRVDQLLRIGGRIGDEIAIAIAIGLVEIAARTVLRVRCADQGSAGDEWREEARDGANLPYHGRLPCGCRARSPDRGPDRLSPARQLSSPFGKAKSGLRNAPRAEFRQRPIACKRQVVQGFVSAAPQKESVGRNQRISY